MLLLLLVEHSTQGLSSRGRQGYPIGQGLGTRVDNGRCRMVSLHAIDWLQQLTNPLVCSCTGIKLFPLLMGTFSS